VKAMNNTKAREILQALIQGVDPDTGKEIPHDSVLQKSGVLRALLAGVGALELTEARAQRRAQLPESVGKRWTDEEDRQLRDEHAGSDPLQLMATKHSRTPRAIEARLERLGLITADQRITGNPFPAVGKKENSDVE
jgi:hypothetical protein